MALPPPIVERRSDERQVFALINALRASALSFNILGAGVLQQTVSSGTPVPEVLPMVAGQIPYGNTNLLLTQSERLYFEPNGAGGIGALRIGDPAASVPLLVGQQLLQSFVTTFTMHNTAGAFEIDTFGDQRVFFVSPAFSGGGPFTYTRFASTSRFFFLGKNNADPTTTMTRWYVHPFQDITPLTTQHGTEPLNMHWWRGISLLVDGTIGVSTVSQDYHVFEPPTFVPLSGWTAPSAATVRIPGAPVDAGAIPAASCYALWATGNILFDADEFVVGAAGPFKANVATNKISFFNVAYSGQVAGGAATAGLIYGATEQTMLQKAYDALRTYGLLS